MQKSKYHKKHVAIFISFVLAKKYLKC